MTLRMGVIGYGGRIEGVIRNCIQVLDSTAAVTAITDIRNDAIRKHLGAAAQGIRFYDDADRMLDSEALDGVLIGTRCDLHTPMAVKVMARNLPLYLEKPVATNRDQILALFEASRSYTAPCVVSFPMRVTPMVLRARQLVREGAIGRLEHMQAVNNVNYGAVYFDQWYRDFGITQGLFLQKATHDIDYLSFIAGERPRQVAAMMSRGRVYGGDKPAGLWCSQCSERGTCPESPDWKRQRPGLQPAWRGNEDHLCCFGVDIGNDQTGCNEDSSSCLIEFESGLQAVYTQNFFARRDAGARGATLLGYDGTIQFDWNTNLFRLIRHHEHETIVYQMGSDVGGHGGGDVELAHDFLLAMRDRAPGRSPLAAGIQSALVCLTCRESAEKRRFLDVPYPEGLRNEADA
jgi:predicted dehydrogenase